MEHSYLAGKVFDDGRRIRVIGYGEKRPDGSFYVARGIEPLKMIARLEASEEQSIVVGDMKAMWI